MNENSYYAKLVEGSNGNYLFEGDGTKYTFKFDPNSEDSWTLSSDDGPIAAEISDTQHYGGCLSAPSGLTWRHARADGGYVHGDIENGEILGLWVRWDVPAGAAASPSTGLVRCGVAFDTVPG